MPCCVASCCAAQAVLNVTNDASRVADLLDEFLSSDPDLKSKFLTFMLEQADTKYSVVDNKLNWVLWLYSLLWMPLLVLMCLTRMGRSSSGEHHRQHVHQAGVAMSGSSLQPGHAGSVPAGEGLGLNPMHATASGQLPEQSGFSSSSTAVGGGASVLTPRRRVASAGVSLDLPPRYSVPGSFGRPPADETDCSMRSAAAGGRTLRQAMSGIAASQRQRASSDRIHMSRPSKLQASSSLPPNAALLAARGASNGSSGSFKGGPGYRQGFDPRLAGVYVAEGGFQGSNGSGADVRVAALVDQAVMGDAGWGMKGAQQGVLGQQAGLVDRDAAAAADVPAHIH